MIYDPTDTGLAMNSRGFLFRLKDDNMWAEIREVRPTGNEPADFRRPEW